MNIVGSGPSSIKCTIYCPATICSPWLLVKQVLQSPCSTDYYGLYSIRDTSSCHVLVQALKSALPSHKHEIVQLDLSSIENVREFANDVNQRIASGSLPPLRAILLNAAVWQGRGQQYSKEGLEMSFAANYLAHFLLVLLLLGSMDREHGCIVITSSYAHDPHHKLNSSFFTEEHHKTVFRDLKTLSHPAPDKKGDEQNSGVRRYGMSKMLLLMFMYEMQRRLDADPSLSKIAILALDPGVMGGTGIVRTGDAASRIFMAYIIPPLTLVSQIFWPNGLLRTPYKSGGHLLFAAFDVEHLGEYPKAIYLNGTEEQQTVAESKDVDKQRRLWTDTVKLVKLVKLRPGDTVLRTLN